MMPALDEAAVRQAILDDPRDDLPRRAYADLLEEAGQDGKAEFVRMQVRLDSPVGINADGKVCSWRMLEASKQDRDREFYLWTACAILLDGLPEDSIPILPAPRTRLSVDRQDAFYATYRRGFVHSVACPLGRWLKQGKMLMQHQPVEWVETTDKKPANDPEMDGHMHEWLYRGEDGEGYACLPMVVFSRLSGRTHISDQGRGKWYPSFDDAMKDFSTVLLSLARGG